MKTIILHFLARLLGVTFTYEIRHLAAGYKRTESRGTLIFTTDDPHLALSRFEEIKANEASHKEGEGYYLAVQTRLAAFGTQGGLYPEAKARKRSALSGAAAPAVEPGLSESNRDQGPTLPVGETAAGSRGDDRQNAGAGAAEGLTEGDRELAAIGAPMNADDRVAGDWKAPSDKDL